MAKQHSKGGTKNLFCYLRASKCGCGNQYAKCCAPSPPWPKYPELSKHKDREQHKARTARMTARGEKGWKPHIVEVRSGWKSHQAHHLLCVAAVSEFVADEIITPIIEQTDWCVNHTDNMIALPMWGHTFRWYCTRSGELRSSRPTPGFVNLCMHNSDHDLYIDDVNTELKDIAKKVKKNKKSHKHRKKQLKAELNSLVKRCRGWLKARGARFGGTHVAWTNAMDGDDTDWFMPFSMGSDGDARSRTFPLAGAGDSEDIEKKLKAYVEAWTGIWG